MKPPQSRGAFYTPSLSLALSLSLFISPHGLSGADPSDDTIPRRLSRIAVINLILWIDLPRLYGLRISQTARGCIPRVCLLAYLILTLIFRSPLYTCLRHPHRINVELRYADMISRDSKDSAPEAQHRQEIPKVLKSMLRELIEL